MLARRSEADEKISSMVEPEPTLGLNHGGCTVFGNDRRSGVSALGYELRSIVEGR